MAAQLPGYLINTLARAAADIPGLLENSDRDWTCFPQEAMYTIRTGTPRIGTHPQHEMHRRRVFLVQIVR
jgi:hypothetical protein